MYRIKKFEVWASEIAGFLNSELIGDDFLVEGPSRIRLECPSGDGFGNVLLLTTQAPREAVCPYLVTQQPELALGHVLREFFSSKSVNTIHKSADISEEAKVGRNVQVGAHSVIGPDVEIGDNTVVMNNVVINGPVVVGKNCVIKDGAVIGSEGWGFVSDEDGIPFHPPQLGKIVIGDSVWIGSNSTIERAMVAETVISTNVKVDDLVHIGAAAKIGKGCMITAGSVIAFNVVLEDGVLVAPHSVIRENLVIGSNISIGLGAIVVNDLSAPGIYVGNPARLLKSATFGSEEGEFK